MDAEHVPRQKKIRFCTKIHFTLSNCFYNTYFSSFLLFSSFPSFFFFFFRPFRPKRRRKTEEGLKVVKILLGD